MQPLSQALQEFPEMAGLYREAHARLAPRGGTVQMLCRIGHGAAVGPSPRWPLEAKLVAARELGLPEGDLSTLESDER